MLIFSLYSYKSFIFSHNYYNNNNNICLKSNIHSITKYKFSRLYKTWYPQFALNVRKWPAHSYEISFAKASWLETTVLNNRNKNYH